MENTEGIEECSDLFLQMPVICKLVINIIGNWLLVLPWLIEWLELNIICNGISVYLTFSPGFDYYNTPHNNLPGQA